MARPSSSPTLTRRRIADLYESGLPIKRIAQDCAVGMSSVYAVVAALPSRRQPPKRAEWTRPPTTAAPAKRRCLCCQRVFQSGWIGNRLCIECRR